MRGRQKLGNVGPLVLFASAVSSISLITPTSRAADLSVSTARTTPASTSAGDGSGPGNITVTAAGSVAVTTDAASVTIDSSHTLTNNGNIASGLASNATGVLATTTLNGAANNITSSITNLGGISLSGPASDSALVNTDVFNAGIRLSGLGTFTGNVSNSATTGDTPLTGSMAVGGNGSYGILIQSKMVGDLTNAGLITISGANSYGIATTGRITGNFTHSGSLDAAEANTVGIYIGGGLEGTALYSGTLRVGVGARLTSTNGVTLTTLDPLPARAGVWLASDVTQGLLLTGNRLTIAQETADPTAAAAATVTDSSIALVGGGPGLFVAQGGLNTSLANITIGVGPNNGGYSIKEQGNIQTAGSISGLASSAITIQGATSNGSIFTTTLTGGLWNDKGNIQTASKDATATGIIIGNYGIVSRIQNDGDLLVSAFDSTIPLAGGLGTKGGDSYGVRVEALGSLTSFANTGIVSALAQGPTSGAYGIVDLSGTLTSFTNSGTIETVLQAGNTTGIKTAVDLRANTSGVTFANSGTITGNVYLGGGNTSVSLSGASSIITGNLTYQAGALKTGNNTFTMNGGKITGLVSLGNGTHTVSLTNGAQAGIAQGTGTLSLSTDASKLTISSASPLTATSAAFANTSVVTFDITSAPRATPVLQSSGTVSFTGGSTMTAAFTGILTAPQTVTLIRANALVLSTPLSQIATTPASFMNEATFSISPTDPNAIILTARRKTAAELGLGVNTTAFYNSFSTALNLDTPVATAISAQPTAAAFQAAINQLMPDSSGATLQAALNSRDMTDGSIRRRLVGVAKNGMPDHAAGDVSSFWIQALGDYGDQKSKVAEQSGYDIWGLGIAFGADTPIFDNTTNVGIALSQSWHSINLKEGARSPVEFYNTQADFYARYSADSFYVQGIAGGGYNSYNQRRHVVIDTVDRTSLGKWKGYEYGGSVEAGYLARIAAFKLTPYVRGDYMKHHENGYVESGGGTGIDLQIDARNIDSARASAGFMLDRNFPIFYDSYVEAELRGNFSRDVKNDPYNVTAQFVSGGSSFNNVSAVRGANRASMGFGIAHKDSYSSVSLDYDAEYSRGYIGHIAAVTARFRF